MKTPVELATLESSHGRSNPPATAAPAQAITRQGLMDGSTLAAFRASAPPGTLIHSDEEIAASLAKALADHPEGTDVYVFAYGSLIWNPAIEFAEMTAARLYGWSRRFCLWLHAGRGSPEQPGLMLAIDRGGACRGVVFRITADMVHHELLLLWRREMLTGSYEAKWVNAVTEHGPVKALTFVVNRSHARYVRGLTLNEMAHYLSTGTGQLGSCAHYLESTLEALKQWGIRDRPLEKLRHAVRGKLGSRHVAAPVPSPEQGHAGERSDTATRVAR